MAHQATNSPAASSSKARMVVPVTPSWFDILPTLPATAGPAVSHSTSQLSTLFDRASSLHASEVSASSALPNAGGGSASDRAFLRNILSGGTLSDRLSALTLMVQGAPLHNTRALDALKGLTERGRGGSGASQEVEKGKGKTTGREDRLKAARAIMDWWVGGGAPNRKLKCVLLSSAHARFHHVTTQALPRPGTATPRCHRSAPHHLVLRRLVEEVLLLLPSDTRGITRNPLLSPPPLTVLQAFSLDPLPYVRMQSLGLITTLLRSNPEQEQNLLRLLVNKLVCWPVSYPITSLVADSLTTIGRYGKRHLCSNVLPPPSRFARAPSDENSHHPRNYRTNHAAESAAVSHYPVRGPKVPTKAGKECVACACAVLCDYHIQSDRSVYIRGRPQRGAHVNGCLLSALPRGR